jgi:hypothetical protein
MAGMAHRQCNQRSTFAGEKWAADNHERARAGDVGLSRTPQLCNQAMNQCGEIINLFGAEPIGSPLVRVLFTKGMITADFLGDPNGYRIGHPSQTHRASGGLTAGIVLAALSASHSRAAD